MPFKVDVNYFFLAPEMALTVLALGVLILDLYVWEGRNRVLAAFSVASLALAAVLSVALIGSKGTTLSNLLVVDSFAIFFKIIVLVSAALVILMSVDYVAQLKLGHLGEYYALLLFATIGMMFMAATTDLVMIYIALELTSISCYILAGYFKRDAKSNEAVLKYFLLGMIASALMLFGFSFLYGFTGHTQLPEIARSVAAQGIDITTIAGVLFALFGFTFKVASVPFHQWVPDVYEGAPTPITAFLSVAPKAAAFAALVRIVFVGFPLFADYWRLLFIILSVASMFVGNLLAIPQTNIKRMLAYSSIAHAGYIIMALAVANERAITGMLIYLVVYVFMNIGAFAVVAALSHHGLGENISDYSGLSQRSPALALTMAIFLVALAGLPPTAGFWGKLYIFWAAVEADLIWLAVIGLLNSVISLYYYVNVIRHMYLFEPTTETPIALPVSFRSVVWVTLAPTLVLGVLPGGLLAVSTISSKGFGI